MIKKQLHIFCLFSVFLLLSLIPGKNAFAKTVIADPADVLSIDEEDTITEKCDTITDHFNVSIYITLSKDMGAKDAYSKYMDQIGKAEDAPRNLVFLFISTKKKDSVIAVKSYGTIRKKMTQTRCDRIASSLENKIDKGDYANALYDFTTTVHEYLGKSPTLDRFYFKVFPHILFSLIFAALLLYMMLHFKAPKTKGELQNYLPAKNAKIYGRHDHFLEMEETRIPKKTLRQYAKAFQNKILSYFTPLWDKVFDFLEPYIATYQKNKRDKKEEKHSPSRNSTEKANVVSKDLINQVARQNTEKKS